GLWKLGTTYKQERKQSWIVRVVDLIGMSSELAEDKLVPNFGIYRKIIALCRIPMGYLPAGLLRRTMTTRHIIIDQEKTSRSSSSYLASVPLGRHLARLNRGCSD